MDRIKFLAVLVLLLVVPAVAVAAGDSKTAPEQAEEPSESAEPAADSADDAAPPAEETTETAEETADSSGSSGSMLLGDETEYTFVQEPWAPKQPINLRGSYSTNLFSGAATYVYPIEVPPGTNGLQPSLAMYYNSLSASGRASWTGLGWSLTQDYIQRDVNYTTSTTSDDKFSLVFEGGSYDLVDQGSGVYKTEIESYLKIRRLAGGDNDKGEYWLVTTKDGTKYRFGYNTNSELKSNINNYAVRWSLDLVNDTSGNRIYYNYTEASNESAVYPKSIIYNNDGLRNITFTFESRPDEIMQYIQGSRIKETKRLSGITVNYDGTKVRAYSLGYDNNIYDSVSFLHSITEEGNNGSWLPSTLFTYKGEPTGWASNSTWNPPCEFTDLGKDIGVRIADVNGDGLPDILRAQAGVSPQTWINNGSGWVLNNSWTSPIDFTGSNNQDFKVHVVDVNGDGLLDFLQIYSDTRDVWLNNGSGWVLNSTWEPPDLPCGEPRVADVNGDGLPDILEGCYPETKSARLNNGNGWTLNSTWDPPCYFINGSNGKDLGVRFIDINGDGLTDVLRGYSTIGSAWLNNGHGWTLNNTWAAPTSFVDSVGRDRGLRIADINGDGLPDFLQGYSGSKHAWFNKGGDWVSNSTWNPPYDFLSSSNPDFGVRIADINGDGLPDILRGYYGVSSAWLNNGSANYRLSSVRTSLGGVINFTYTPSTIFDNTGNDEISDLNFPLDLLSRVTYDNGMSGAHEVNSQITYNYSGGLYDYQDREFRGFAYAKEISPYNVQEHWFHQDDARKGQENRTELSDLSGDLFSKTENDWGYAQSGGVYTVELNSTTNSVYDGYTTPFVTKTEFWYDGYGNIIYQKESGKVGTSGDERYTYTTYAYNTTAWIVNRANHTYVLDPDEDKVSETWYYYDNQSLDSAPVRGLLTKQENWLDGGSNPITEYVYDTYGNPVSVVDAEGHEANFTYDSATHTFKVEETNALGHKTLFAYDQGTGNLLNSTDSNGVVTKAVYDEFGRILKEIRAYDSQAYPTKQYAYSLDGTAPEGINVSARTGGSDYLDSYTFVDGFGNVIQTASDAEASGQQVVTNLYYNEMGQVGNKSVPYTAANSSGYHTPQSARSQDYGYDASGRLVEVNNTDDTSKTYDYDRDNVTVTDENGHEKVYKVDAYGNIIEVDEKNDGDTYVTTYSYDSLNKLVSIEDDDGNLYEFGYDTLGRKIWQDDPDVGNWSYAYDGVGNLLNQTDERGVTTQFIYDSLNRVTRKDYPADADVNYYYDEDLNGTLSRVGDNVSEFGYAYDDRYRTVQKGVEIDELQWTTEWAYDSADRVTSMLYPDGQNVSFTYNNQGQLETVSGIVDNIDYNAQNKITLEAFHNGKNTTYTYDSESFRLTRIYSPGLQDLNYEFDDVGNIVGIYDAIDDITSNFTYDDLDRLLTATGDLFDLEYAYNAIGNIVSVTSGPTISYYYEGAGPHAVTSTNSA